MRLKWQCPICYAEIGDKGHAEMITCPYCGTLLIVDSENKKFYPVKRGRGWHYFPKVYLRGYDGHIKLGGEEFFFRYTSEKWYLHLGNEIYELVNKKMNCIYNVETSIGAVWGDIPLLATPEQKIFLGFCEGGLAIKTGKKEYRFMKIY